MITLIDGPFPYIDDISKICIFWGETLEQWHTNIIYNS